MTCPFICKTVEFYGDHVAEPLKTLAPRISAANGRLRRSPHLVPWCRRRGGGLGWAILLAGLAILPARGQLAITELMSLASTNCLQGLISHPDFWELTNFGSEFVDLSGYIFRDDPLPSGGWRIEPGVMIGPGESMVFLRRQGTESLDAAAFCAWWGLPSCPSIQFYEGFGFDELGEELWLWDADTNLLDFVSFGEARMGVTFTYHPDTGRFGELSEVDICGAWQAAQCLDVGSPGSAACGTVEMVITEHPANQTVDAGGDVTFSIQAEGMPRPRLQWYFNDQPQAGSSTSESTFATVVNHAGSGLAWKPTGKATDLVLLSVDPGQAGEYYAVLDNGLKRMTSAVAILMINTNASPPRIVAPAFELRWPELDGHPPTNLVVAPGQTAEFAVLVRGYPPPTFQWSWSPYGADFSDLNGATNSSFVIPHAQTSMAGVYRVRVENALGSADASASLSVKPAPELRITEAMAQAFDPRHPDWWELTNTGTEAVQLYGIRWDDAPGNIGAGPTITNAVLLPAGASAILVETRTPEIFRQWWGELNLPPNLPIIPFAANGLTEFGGDEINIWMPTATVDFDHVDSVVFEDPQQGVSLWFGLDSCFESKWGVLSVPGQCGAFQAADGDDVGSPGWTAWTPPHVTSIRHEGENIRLEWRAQPGSLNLLQFTRQLRTPADSSVWTDLGVHSFADPTGFAIDTTLGGDRQRFYRLIRLAPDNCPCPIPP